MQVRLLVISTAQQHAACFRQGLALGMKGNPLSLVFQLIFRPSAVDLSEQIASPREGGEHKCPGLIPHGVRQEHYNTLPEPSVPHGEGKALGSAAGRDGGRKRERGRN